MSGRTGKGPLAVVIVYAFDCTTSTPEWYKVDNVFWCVQEKLTRIVGSSLGYTYVMSTPNTYTSDMKLVDSTETKEKGYTGSSSWKRTACIQNMASGLHEAHRLITQQGNQNGIILLFSDGLVNKGDFFDGAENIDSNVPVYTFTLGGDAYNQGLRTIAAKSSGGMFSPLPVPDKPSLSVPFSQLMDSILDGSNKYHEKNPSPTSGRWPLDVVIVSAFDCTASTPAWHKVDGEVFWLVQKKLTRFVHSCLGYTYVMSTPNTYTSEMKLVDFTEIEANGYTCSSAWRRNACTNNMAAGLSEAHRMISDHGHLNGIILLFSDGLINSGNFFDGAQGFISKVPVHTFTLGGVAYNQALRDIATNSPGGTFNFLPVPEKPSLSVPFSRLVDRILNGTPEDGRWPLDVVIVFAFDITKATSIYAKKDHQVYWLVQKKLTNFVDSCLGYIHFESKYNEYDYDMKLVDSTDKPTGYKPSKAWTKTVCTKNMSAGLSVAQKMITHRGHSDGIILLLSDGLTNAGDFFDGVENFASQVPVHTFTLGGPAYNQGLRTIAAKSPGGMFHSRPVPENPSQSAPFSLLLDRILNGTMKAGKWPLDVVIVYAFDCTTSTPNWYNMDHVFWLVQEKLAGRFTDSCLGYTYVMSTPNTCTSDMKIVDSTETKVKGYTGSPARQRTACTKYMASGLSEAHKLISYREHQNSIILFFSDGLINKGDYFDGAENFPSKVPVHTFTLGGNAYNQGLLAIAENSPGGMFHPLPVPDNPNQSVPFSDLLDRILGGTA